MKGLVLIFLASVAVLLSSSCATKKHNLNWKSEHFDGDYFFNKEKIDRSIKDLLTWLWHRERKPWSEITSVKTYTPPPQHVLGDNLSVTHINHATTLIQTQGINILTDPIWSDRAGPDPFPIIGAKRYRPPGVKMENLPPIDYILISHNHYDHLDLATLRKLNKKHEFVILTGLGNKDFLRKNGFSSVMEFDWWEHFEIGNALKISAVPARHWSKRNLFDHNKSLWCGFVVHTEQYAIYFAGDTSFGDHFEQIHKKFGDFRLALIPIGAYLPNWFMKDVHTSPSEAVEIHKILHAKTSIPIHYDVFSQGDESQGQALTDLQAALKVTPINNKSQFITLGFGESKNIN